MGQFHRDRKRILLVDDENDLLIPIQLALESQGYEVYCAHDGEEAFTLAHTLAPDAMVIDVLMPKKDGLRLCRELRSNPPHEHLRIIMLSAKASAQDESIGGAVGADEYITKPFDMQHLLHRVHVQLTR